MTCRTSHTIANAAVQFRHRLSLFKRSAFPHGQVEVVRIVRAVVHGNSKIVAIRRPNGPEAC
eukprot:4207431-Pyramimonas_sp.AAC.1